MGQPWVALYAGVAERSVFITTEGKDGLIHLLGVEHLETDEQVEILDRQPGDSEKQIRFEFCDYILQRVLAEIGEIHECWNAGCKLNQLFEGVRIFV